MALKVRDYEVRLVQTPEERKQVRQLRYKVFVEEEGASATEEQRNLREEYDAFDRLAEYMAVFHGDKVVATYRIIDREAAKKMGGFYTKREFNISKILRIKGNIAEMSRACVDPEYRGASLSMRMLWMGLADYVLKNNIVILFGIASFVGTKPVESAHAISYLYYNHLTPMRLRSMVNKDNFPKGINPQLSRMNILPKSHVDAEVAQKQMTPLVKGYLRLGATFGKGVFIDSEFNSYDVFVLVQTRQISAAYQKHFTGNPAAFEHLGIKPGTLKKFGKLLLSPVTELAGLAWFFLKPEDAKVAEIVEDEKAE